MSQDQATTVVKETFALKKFACDEAALANEPYEIVTIELTPDGGRKETITRPPTAYPPKENEPCQ